MLVLITYDVSTTDAGGKRRLAQIARICVRYGQRVQNSVFECLVEPHELALMKNEILKIMDEKKDSIRIYNMGKKYTTKIEHYGTKMGYAPEGVLML